MCGGNLALRNRDETREPCFRRKQVVTAEVEPVVLDQVADREEITRLVVQKAEIHFVEQLARPARKRSQAIGEFLDCLP